MSAEILTTTNIHPLCRDVLLVNVRMYFVYMRARMIAVHARVLCTCGLGRRYAGAYMKARELVSVLASHTQCRLLCWNLAVSSRAFVLDRFDVLRISKGCAMLLCTAAVVSRAASCDAAHREK